MTPIFPIILCGGAGARLWPVSRELHPKPFLRLPDGYSLLQKAYLRAAALPGANQILTVTNRELLWKSKDEYNRLACTLGQRFILEPFARNTASAIAVVAWDMAHAYGDDAIALVLPADHLISDETAFASAVDKAVALAQEGKLVTFGIKPSRPEAGYGYIEADGTRALRFIEKPDAKLAAEFIAAGNYLWNSGMFCFRVGTLLEEMGKYAPQIRELALACLENSPQAEGKEFSQVELNSDLFKILPNVSIDYALMEKSSKVAVVHCDIGWSDIGSWDAISNLQPADENNNRIVGQALLQDVSNCYIQSDAAAIGVIGVANLLIVHTPDALLVADRSRAQDVKEIVSQLKQAGNEAYRLHKEVYRPWGKYTVVEEGRHFKIKRIVVKPDASLSLQMHRHRSEHWTVVSGRAKIVCDEREFYLHVNESTFIGAGQQHRLSNPDAEELVIIEVQVGEYLEEDDIVRFDDQYGRTLQKGAKIISIGRSKRLADS